MNWTSDLDQPPLSQRTLSDVSFFIRPYLTETLELDGQRVFGSDFYTFDEDGNVREEDFIPGIEDCPFLNPYCFDIRIAGFFEEEYYSESIGQMLGYYIEIGYLLDDILQKGNAGLYYDGVSQFLSDFWCDLAEMVKEPDVENPLFQLLFNAWDEEGAEYWTLDSDQAIFLLSNLELDEKFKQPPVIALTLNTLLPNYFEKHRPFLNLAGILHEKWPDEALAQDGEVFDPHFKWLKQACEEAGMIPVQNKVMDYFLKIF